MIDIIDEFTTTLTEKVANGVHKLKETNVETPEYEQLLKNIVSSIQIVGQFSQRFAKKETKNSDHITKGDN